LSDWVAVLLIVAEGMDQWWRANLADPKAATVCCVAEAENFLRDADCSRNGLTRFPM